MIQAIGKNIVVKPIYPEKKTVLHLVSEEKPIYFEVLSIGDIVKEVICGDKIFINQYGAQEKTFNDEKYYVTSIEHVYGKIKE